AVDPVHRQSKESVLFGKLVIREGLLSAEQVHECLAQQARSGETRSLGEIMVAKGLLRSDQVRDLLAKQQKRIMACPACRMSFTVLSITQGRSAVSCPRCKGTLSEAAPGAPPGTHAEFATQVIRAARKELPPGSVKDSRILPPNAKKVRATCVVCDHPFGARRLDGPHPVPLVPEHLRPEVGRPAIRGSCPRPGAPRGRAVRPRGGRRPAPREARPPANSTSSRSTRTRRRRSTPRAAPPRPTPARRCRASG